MTRRLLQLASATSGAKGQGASSSSLSGDARRRVTRALLPARRREVPRASGAPAATAASTHKDRRVLDTDQEEDASTRRTCRRRPTSTGVGGSPSTACGPGTAWYASAGGTVRGDRELERHGLLLGQSAAPVRGSTALAAARASSIRRVLEARQRFGCSCRRRSPRAATPRTGPRSRRRPWTPSRRRRRWPRPACGP